MNNKVKSIRTFIGAKDFDTSRSFYRDWGFEEVALGEMSFFRKDGVGFYLQKAYVKDWVDNSMLFLEVADLDVYWKELEALQLDAKYEHVRLVPIKTFDWGKEGFIYDPSGILWHIGEFFE